MDTFCVHCSEREDFYSFCLHVVLTALARCNTASLSSMSGSQLRGYSGTSIAFLAGSRLQFVLQSACYNALVDQSRAGEVKVGIPQEQHDEVAMKVRRLAFMVRIGR